VVDSLSALAALFPEQQQLTAFLQCCRALGGSLGAPASRIAVLAAADVAGDTPLLLALQHAADGVVTLAPVEGRTAELDGRVEVTLRRVAAAGSSSGGGGSSSTQQLPGTCTWHFRATDVAVRWLPEQLEGEELMV